MAIEVDVPMMNWRDLAQVFPTVNSILRVPEIYIFMAFKLPHLAFLPSD